MRTPKIVRCFLASDGLYHTRCRRCGWRKHYPAAKWLLGAWYAHAHARTHQVAQ